MAEEASPLPVASNINEWVKVQAKRKEWLVKEVEKAQKKA
ncbi:hypothetical protein ADUPG1_014011, partial [Aduncisulcus paluster]